MDDDVRWLDAEEQSAWLSLLEGWKRFEHRLDRDLKSTHGITLEDYEILAFLSFAPDNRLRMSELADRLLVSRSRLTYRVDRLEKPGYVARRPCPEDGRSVWAELTDGGRDLLARAAPGHVTAVRELLVDHFDRDEWLLLGRRFRAVAEGIGGPALAESAARRPDPAVAPPARSIATILELDHVIVVTDDLDGAAERLEADHGLVARPGGRHAGHGTGNRIVPLGPDYIELMAVVDPDEAGTSPLGRWVAATAAAGGGPSAVCLRTDDLDGLCDRLGLEATPMSRTRPDGVELRWRLAGLEVALGQDRLPFFIEWDVDDADHPGAMAASHASPTDGIERVEVGGPEQALAEWAGQAVPGVVPVGGPPGVGRLQPGW